jgi:Family of unknown function (DUF6518)
MATVDRLAKRFGRQRTAPFAVRLTVVLVLGLGVGALTSVLQAHLNTPWLSLVNSASPWLVPAFVVGTMQRRLPGAAAAGLVTVLLELIGYTITSHARGFASSHSLLIFWGVCAVVGGPIFGAAGNSWWRHRRTRAALGAAILAAAFLAEGLVAYQWRLGYTSSAVLFCVIGALIALVLGSRRHQLFRTLRWLPATFVIGALGESLLGLIYKQSVG